MPVSANHSRLPLTRFIGFVSAVAFGFGLNVLLTAARPEPVQPKAALTDKLEENRIAAREATVPPQGFGTVTSETNFSSFRPSFVVAPSSLHYKVTELNPKLEDYPGFQPRAINNKSEVIGNAYSIDRRTSISPRHVSFLYRNGKYEKVATPQGYDHVILMDLNDNGQAAGVTVSYDAEKRPFARVVLYDKGKLKLLEEMQKAFGTERKPISTELTPRINNAGDVSAWYYGRTYVWKKGVVSDIGRGRVLDMNNRGTLVGVIESRNGSAAYWKDGKAEDLLAAGRYRSPQGAADLRGSAEAVNEKGQIVVSMPLNPGARYTDQRTLYILTDGKKDRTIATFLGPQYGRTRINNRGDVVGLAQLVDAFTSVPFLYSGGKMYDMNAAIKDQNWTLSFIMDINDRGEMVALATRPGENRMRGVLLTPIQPAPATTVATQKPAVSTAP